MEGRVKLFGFEIKRAPPNRPTMPGQGYVMTAPRPNQARMTQKVGDALTSSVIAAPLLWVARAFPESPVLIETETKDGFEVVKPHPLTQLLSRPNPYYSGAALWMATTLSYNLNGNAYWAKVRDNRGAVIELWYIPHWLIEPKTESGSADYLSYYEYRPAGQAIRLAPEDVVHFRFGLDPNNIRKGLSPLASLLAEVFTDLEAATFTAALLENSGVPGLIVSPADPTARVPDAAAADIKQKLMRLIGGKRGEPLVLTAPTKVEQFGFDPQQLDLKALRRVPEERVSAVLGVPAIVAGLGAGLDRSTFANMAEAREMAYENNIIPTQRLFSDDLGTQLLPDFEPNPERFRLRFDLSNVRVLQDDENKLAARLTVLYKGGLMMRSEGRRRLNLPVTPEDETYFQPTPAQTTLEPPPEPPKQHRPQRKNATRNYDALWKATDDARQPFEASTAIALQAALEDQGERIANQIANSSDPESENIALNDDGITDALRDNLSELMYNAGLALLTELEPPKTDPQWLQAAEDWLKQHVGISLAYINDTTRQIVTRIITLGLEQGQSIPDIADNIRSTLVGTSLTRAVMIARTETVAASNAAREFAARDFEARTGQTLTREWIATRDARTRDAHRSADRQTAPPGADFVVGGESASYPGDPRLSAKNRINCRCTIAYIPN